MHRHAHVAIAAAILFGLLAPAPALARKAIPDLNQALWKDSPKKAAELIEKGRELDDTDLWGYRPLHLAALKGHADIVRVLLDKGVNVDTPLDSELENKDIPFNQRKLRKNLFKPNLQGLTPLYLASQNAHLDVMQILIDYGANVDAPMHNGDTPLIIAIAKNHPEAARLLIEHGANPATANSGGTTPLMFAALNGQEDIVGMLVDAHANVNQQNHVGNTALILATRGAYMGIINNLLAAGANTNLHGWGGETALYNAAAYGHTDVARVLLEAGADVSEPNSTGRTPAHVAGAKGRTETIDFLLDHGAVPSVIDSTADDCFGAGLTHRQAALRDERLGEAADAQRMHARAAEFFTRAADGYEKLDADVSDQLRSKRIKRGFGLALGAFLAEAGARAQANVSDIGQGVQTVQAGGYSEAGLKALQDRIRSREKESRTLAAAAQSKAGVGATH